MFRQLLFLVGILYVLQFLITVFVFILLLAVSDVIMKLLKVDRIANQ